MSDLASIIIVTHNNWPDLELAIQSALHQSYRPVEVMVVDNASTDATPDMVSRRFGDSVRYLWQSANVLDGGGYNAGFRAARGEFIQFLDADDFLAPDKIEKQVEAFRADPDVDIVRGQFRQFQRSTGSARWSDIDVAEYDDLLTRLIASDGVGSGAGLVIHNILFRRRALEAIGPWDEEIVGADLDMFLRAAWAGLRFRYCPESLCFYQVRPGQMSADSPTHLRNREKTWAKALEYVTAEPHRSAIARKLARLRFYVAISPSMSTRRERLEKLREAYHTHSATVSVPVLLIGWLLASAPGARALLNPPLLHAFRSRMASALDLK